MSRVLTFYLLCYQRQSADPTSTNMIDENAQFERRHVLYCDLLGFSRYSLGRFFEHSRCFRLFRQLDKMVVNARIEIDPSVPDLFSGLPPDYVVKPEAIYFSDTIVISTVATNIDAIWLCEAAGEDSESHLFSRLPAPRSNRNWRSLSLGQHYFWSCNCGGSCIGGIGVSTCYRCCR